MPTRSPVNPRASVDAVLVDDLDDAPAGAFEFYDFGRPLVRDVGILLKCPCGCGTETAMPFQRISAGDNRPVWTWDGNRERPTVTPSLLIYQLDDAGLFIGEHWHGFLTNGRWISC